MPRRFAGLLDDDMLPEPLCAGEESCGGAETAQIFIVESAEPDTSIMRCSSREELAVDKEEAEEVGLPDPLEVESDSLPIWGEMEEEWAGRTQMAQIASVWPSIVALGSTRPRSQTRMVES